MVGGGELGHPESRSASPESGRSLPAPLKLSEKIPFTTQESKVRVKTGLAS